MIDSAVRDEPWGASAAVPVADSFPFVPAFDEHSQPSSFAAWTEDPQLARQGALLPQLPTQVRQLPAIVDPAKWELRAMHDRITQEHVG
jgi:hypothetical protein